MKLSEIVLNSLTRSDGDDFDKFILRDIVKGDVLEGLTDIFTKGCLQVSGSIKIALVRAVYDHNSVNAFIFDSSKLDDVLEQVKLGASERELTALINHVLVLGSIYMEDEGVMTIISANMRQVAQGSGLMGSAYRALALDGMTLGTKDQSAGARKMWVGLASDPALKVSVLRDERVIEVEVQGGKLMADGREVGAGDDELFLAAR